MKAGKTLEALATAVDERARRKDDFVVPTPMLVMLNGRELSLPTSGEGGMGEERLEVPLSQIAHRQIGERLGLPAKFYDSLREDDNENVKRLLDTNVNTLFRERPKRALVRTFKPAWWGTDGEMHVGVTPMGEMTRGTAERGEPGTVRAFLSDRYRKRDDEDILGRVVPMLGTIPGAEVVSSEITDTKLYLKIIAPRVQGEVSQGDYVQAGVVISNSEVGHGALQVTPFVYRLICTNGMVVPESLGDYLVGRHVGGRVMSDEALRAYSDETLKLDDEAFFAKVSDVVAMAVDETKFAAIVAEMQRAKASSPITDVGETVERLVNRYDLSEGEGKSVLQHLAAGGDLSAYGALNAITRTAEDAETYDRATELETIGGELLVLSEREWEAVAA